MNQLANISFHGFADICTHSEIAAAESKILSQIVPSLTCGEVDEIIDMLVETRHRMGNQSIALSEWLTDNDRKIKAHQFGNLLLLAQTAWEDIREEAANA